MANQLDEMNPVLLKEGKDVNVIAKQLPVTVGSEGIVYQFCVCATGLVPLTIGIILFKSGEQNAFAGILCCACSLLPALGLYFARQRVESYFNGLEQRIQAAASRLDNYLEQRVVILKNAAKILERQMNFEKETYTAIASLRSGIPLNDQQRNELGASLDKASGAFVVNVEAYPTLQSIQVVQDAMSQNTYLQKEITAARELYNAEVMRWNTDVFAFPLKKIVAASRGYTTRIPFIASEEIKKQARDVFF